MLGMKRDFMLKMNDKTYTHSDFGQQLLLIYSPKKGHEVKYEFMWVTMGIYISDMNVRI